MTHLEPTGQTYALLVVAVIVIVLVVTLFGWGP
jgi:hypothetical protein